MLILQPYPCCNSKDLAHIRMEDSLKGKIIIWKNFVSSYYKVILTGEYVCIRGIGPNLEFRLLCDYRQITDIDSDPDLLIALLGEDQIHSCFHKERVIFDVKIKSTRNKYTGFFESIKVKYSPVKHRYITLQVVG